MLTAGHVFDPNPAPETVTVQFNLGGAPIVRAAAGYRKHPDYISFGNPNTQNDLAIIELAADAPAGALVYALASRVPVAGTAATLVGYGGSGYGDAGISVARAADVKRTGRNSLDAFDYDAKGGGKVLVYYFDFDGPSAATNVVGAGTLGNALETTVAGGDSGSGTLRTPSGRIITVTRRFCARPSGVVMSAATAVTARPVAARISAAVASSSLAVRELITRSTPFFASAMAHARPNPLLAAHTIAFLSLMPKSMLRSLRVVCCDINPA